MHTKAAAMGIKRDRLIGASLVKRVVTFEICRQGNGIEVTAQGQKIASSYQSTDMGCAMRKHHLTDNLFVGLQSESMCNLRKSPWKN